MSTETGDPSQPGRYGKSFGADSKWCQDTSKLTDFLGKGRSGIVISGLVTWVKFNLDCCDNNALFDLALSHFTPSEVTEARNALMSALDPELLELEATKHIPKRRNKKDLELKDIFDILRNVNESQGLPIILSTPGSFGMCPQLWGKSRPRETKDDNATMELKNMLNDMQTFIMGQIKNNSDSIDALKKEVRTASNTFTRKSIPRKASDIESFSQLSSPLKRGRLDDIVRNNSDFSVSNKDGGISTPSSPTTPSFSSSSNNKELFAKVAGKHTTVQNKNIGKPVRKPKNILIGNGKPKEDYLSANVSLVASGCGLKSSADSLKEHLLENDLEPLSVTRLTKDDVIEHVNSLTYKVTVKACDLDDFLKSEKWPFRVSVRYFRNFRPPRKDDSRRKVNYWSNNQSSTRGITPLSTSNMFQNLEEVNT